MIQVTPLTGWSEKKANIVSNVVVNPSGQNGLTKKSIADCLQTRPVDHQKRLVKIRGRFDDEKMAAIDEALRIVFAL